jgi:dCTP deaminase
MILSDRDIKKALKEGKIKITPAIDFSEQLGPCSIDLKLGNVFRVFNHSKCAYIDTKEKITNLTKKMKVKKGEPFIMQPGDFVLASTLEKLELSIDLLARLEGRSSLGRLGITIHSTAAVFEPGWRGRVVMELGNLGKMPVALYPGMRICSVTFEKMSSPVEVPYDKKKGAKYVDQKEPVPSKLSEEMKKG